MRQECQTEFFVILCIAISGSKAGGNSVSFTTLTSAFCKSVLWVGIILLLCDLMGAHMGFAPAFTGMDAV